MAQTLALPPLGLGTWKLKGADCEKAVLKGLAIGYRHVDTAQVYHNEAEVGAGLATALETGIVTRAEVVVATKVWITRLSRKKLKPSLLTSLQALRLDYVDVAYVHWPARKYKAEETLPALAELVDDRLVRHVGVSNFTPELLDEAQAACPKPIAVNQVEHHPWLPQRELREYCAAHDIRLVAYSPLGQGNILDDPALLEVGQKHDATPAQVALAWIMAHDAVPIPKATSEAHLRDNFGALEVTLDADDLARVNAIPREKRFLNPPFLRPKW